MLLCDVLVFFFFKQKTAYEMRISDWSSDVCSSDLPDRNGADYAMVAMADGALPLPLHCSPKEARGPVAEALADAAERARPEHWRLAYVALTRAAAVLVVPGWLCNGAGGEITDATWSAGYPRRARGGRGEA